MTPRLHNTTTRPVELHLLVGTVVIPAQGSADCAAADLDHGQVRELVRRGVLVVRDEEPEPDPDPGPEPDPEPPKRRTRRTRSTEPTT